MAAISSKILIQAIIAVKSKGCLIDPLWEERFQQCISGILHDDGHEILAVAVLPDHVHLFFSLRPDCSLNGAVNGLKSRSSKWINENHFTREKFRWQSGFGAFTYSRSQSQQVKEYLQNQKAFHAGRSFLSEFREFLDKFELGYAERQLFKPV